MWFDNWNDVLRVALVGAAAYLALVLVLRVSGKRTLAKLNAFDFVVTVALGSTLATILLSSDVALVEGVAALVLLAALQFAVAKLTTMVPRLRSLVTADPALVVQDGEVLEGALARQRVSLEELRQVVRSSGYGDLAQIGAVVLETDGTLSVISSGQMGSGWTLANVRRPG
jgi:uncharacterized membrane protein YcaP (DUF421 family)